jgi:hypothetical protein
LKPFESYASLQSNIQISGQWHARGGAWGGREYNGAKKSEKQGLASGQEFF